MSHIYRKFDSDQILDFLYKYFLQTGIDEYKINVDTYSHVRFYEKGSPHPRHDPLNRWMIETKYGSFGVAEVNENWSKIPLILETINKNVPIIITTQCRDSHWVDHCIRYAGVYSLDGTVYSVDNADGSNPSIIGIRGRAFEDPRNAIAAALKKINAALIDSFTDTLMENE